MSQYRTISSTDLKSIEKLNFTFSTLNVTPSTTSFDLLNDSTYVSTPRGIQSNNFYSNNSSQSSLVSLEYIRSASPKPVKNAQKIDTNPCSGIELQERIPLIFKKNQDLNQYFHKEFYFASNLSNLNQVLMNNNQEFEFEEGLILHPISRLIAPKHYKQMNEMIDQIIELLDSIIKLIEDSNEDLLKKYDEMVKRPLKLAMLTNSRLYHNFEHSRLMMESLITSKKLFEAYVFNADLFNSLVDDLINLIFDYNQYVSDYDLGRDPSTSTTMTTDTTDLFDKIDHVESFTNTKDCYRQFESLLVENFFVFNEFTIKGQEFIKKLAIYEKFNYEIVSLDDHLKFSN